MCLDRFIVQKKIERKKNIKEENHADHPDVFSTITQFCEFWTTRVARAEDIVVGEKTKIKTKNHADHPDVFLIITQSCEFWTSTAARAEENSGGRIN